MEIENHAQNNNNVPSRKAAIGSGPNVLRSPIPYDTVEEGANLSAGIVKCFKKYSNKTLVIDGPTGLKWTGAQLLDTSSRIVTKLVQEMDLGPNKNIALLCDHSDREIVFALSCFIAGCSIYPQNPDDGLEEIKTICTMIPVNAIATQYKHHQLVAELRKSLPNKNVPIIWVDDQMISTIGNEEINNNNDDSEYRRDLVARDGVVLVDDVIHHGNIDVKLIEKLGSEMIKPKECPGYYMLTSGSTGYPKVVEIMQWGVISSASQMHCCCETVWPAGLENERMLPLTGDSVLAGDLPMDHGAGISFLIMAMMLGSKYVVLPVNSLDKLDNLFDSIKTYKIEFLINGSTKIFQFLKRVVDDSKSSTKTDIGSIDLTSLRFIITVGARVNFEPLIRDFEKLYPNVQVTQSYGLTEVGYVATLPLSVARETIQSVGWLFPGVTGIVADSASKQLGPNEKGELHVYSDSLFARYICRQGIDAEKVLADCRDSKGYYKTGDLVHYDEQGKLFIHSRIKETLVLRGEWKILPAELEAIVGQHPLIESNVIVGVPDPEVPGVEVPKAFVKLVGQKSEKYATLQRNANVNSDKHAQDLIESFENGDNDAIAKDIFNFAAARTAEVKHLTGGVRIIEDFPKNGRLRKIDRKKLKMMP